jgi:NAD(P)-dependent dehydrogenase (short-subunit alcohol dehydrogenase family)
MVKLSTITEVNAGFARDHSKNEGLVCVFSGATGGIGAGTIEQMATILQGATFYVLGRSAVAFAIQRAKLESLNPTLKLVFLETQLSLIVDVDAACKKIAAAEQKVDCLYMSQACFPINVPQCKHLLPLTSDIPSLTPKDTKEGIDLSFALQYYSRMRLLMNLLPLLRNSSRPRIVSVLSGGKEQQMRDDDIGLENPDHYTWQGAIVHHATMTSLAFGYLAENDKKITFMHVFPGLVSTRLFSRVAAPSTSGQLARTLTALFAGFGSLLVWLLGVSALDCGARQAFLLTNDKYGPGALRIGDKSELVTAPGVLSRYREQGWQGKVWNYTLGVFEKALAASE